MHYYTIRYFFGAVTVSTGRQDVGKQLDGHHNDRMTTSANKPVFRNSAVAVAAAA